MTRVKICGVRDAATAVAAMHAGADLIGLVFAESIRKVTPQECHDVVEALRAERRVLAAHIDGPHAGEVSGRTWFSAWNEAIDDAIFHCRPLVAGVFADMTSQDVNEIADAAGLDIVQLSGGESDRFCREIRLPVLRVIHVEEQATAEDVFDRAVPGISAAILLDTASAVARGGTGETFDWAVAAEVAARLPIVLAGGLTAENVAGAVAGVHPWAVDVSSGVETNGRKDIEKIRAFIGAAKGAPVER
ncbi:phosphoribosylanthranilate isomerase [bacterium]|nr:MAG: phosphoribosylanthranilate isomerase [bacterium]MCL4231828.1 phosphoribosylanthranilate isomerase [Dehalococcoidia bacterium]